MLPGFTRTSAADCWAEGRQAQSFVLLGNSMSQETACRAIRSPDLRHLVEEGGSGGGVSIHYVKATVSAGPFLDKLGRTVSLPIGMSLSLSPVK